MFFIFFSFLYVLYFYRTTILIAIKRNILHTQKSTDDSVKLIIIIHLCCVNNNYNNTEFHIKSMNAFIKESHFYISFYF